MSLEHDTVEGLWLSAPVEGLAAHDDGNHHKWFMKQIRSVEDTNECSTSVSTAYCFNSPSSP